MKETMHALQISLHRKKAVPLHSVLSHAFLKYPFIWQVLGKIKQILQRQDPERGNQIVLIIIITKEN